MVPRCFKSSKVPPELHSGPSKPKKNIENYSTGEPHMSILDGWTYLGWTYLRLIYVLRSDYCHDNPGN